MMLILNMAFVSAVSGEDELSYVDDRTKISVELPEI
jgi:hypothetical protein